jgi:hypothetical protein
LRSGGNLHFGNRRPAQDVADNGVVAAALHHLDDVIAELAFDRCGYFAFLQAERTGKKRRIPGFFVTVNLVLAATVFRTRVFAVAFCQLLERGNFCFHLSFVAIQFVNYIFLQVAGGFGINYNLPDLQLRFVKRQAVLWYFIKIGLLLLPA